MAKQNTAIQVIANQNPLMPAVAEMESLISDKANKIYHSKTNELAKIDFSIATYSKKAKKLEAKINAMPEVQELKKCNTEIKRLKQYAKKVAESIETTLTDDLYDIAGETLYDKISNLKKGAK
jgi:cell fate (sporulation/competence/biofilm development) regulator YmcA (YheA/YmcA/DUF963 family)